jgi:predicted metalloendopeptidase
MGIAPLKPFLKKIDAVKNAKDLEALLIEMEPIGIGFMGAGVGTDAKTAAEM